MGRTAEGGGLPTRGRAPVWRWLVAILGWGLFVAALVAARMVREQLPWVPLWYLGALLAIGVAAWRLLRWRRGRALVRWPGLGLSLLTVVALCPVPWLTADLDDPPGTAWRLDGRLAIEGRQIDPPGAWYWLTVGRPPLVAEVVAGWITGGEEPHNLAVGSRAARPVFNEPAAAAVGLRRAGVDLELEVVVEVREPLIDGLPASAALISLNGVRIMNLESWRDALATLGEHNNTILAAGGGVLTFDGAELPYRFVDVLERPVEELDVAVGGRWALSAPGRWFRNLAVGRSHGLMVALMTYADASGRDLAGGLTIAGTGGIRSDGSVSRIGGLRAKAEAAREVGADVLLFPAEQAPVLAGFDPGTMHLLPVSTLDEAIAALVTTRAQSLRPPHS